MAESNAKHKAFEVRPSLSEVGTTTGGDRKCWYRMPYSNNKEWWAGRFHAWAMDCGEPSAIVEPDDGAACATPHPVNVCFGSQPPS